MPDRLTDQIAQSVYPLPLVNDNHEFTCQWCQIIDVKHPDQFNRTNTGQHVLLTIEGGSLVCPSCKIVYAREA